MKAVIMAGGEGTRLRPLTSNQPKPMLPMANIPMMEHVVNLLRQHGFEDVVVTVAFMANAIRTYFGDGSEFGVRMVYATEPTPLGTAGSVLNARDELDERFLVISGDVLTDLDLSALVGIPRRSGRPRHPRTEGRRQPARVRDRHHPARRLDRALPREADLGPGLQRHHQHGDLRARAGDLRLHPRRTSRRLLRRLVPRRARRGGAAVRLRRRGLLGGRGHSRGVPEGPPGHPWPAGAGRHRRVPAATGSVDRQGCGDRPERRAGRSCGGGGQLRDRTPVRASASTARSAATSGSATTCSSSESVVHDNTYLGSGVRLEGSVLGRGSDLREGVRCEEGRRPRRRVLRRCPRGDQGRGEDLSVQDRRGRARSSTRRSSGSRGARGCSSAATVSRAWRTWTSAPSWPCASRWRGRRPSRRAPPSPLRRDTSRAARVLKRAVMVGCNAAGINVDDLEAATVPVTRFQVSSSASKAGVTVRLAPDDPQSVILRFFDSEGIDVDEATQRKIERVYHREDFRRVLAREIGDIGFPPRSLEFYTAALIDSVDLASVRRAGLKLVLDYSFGTTSFVMPNLLAKLEAEVLVGQSVRQHRERVDLRPPGERRPGVGTGAGLRCRPRRGLRSGWRVRVHRGRPWSRALERRGAPRDPHPGHRSPTRCAHRASRRGEQRGRGDLPQGGRRDRLDQAVGVAPDGGGPLREGHPRGQPVRRFHLPPLPSGVRRRGDHGQPDGDAHRERTRPSRSWWPSCRPCTSPTRPSTLPGSRRGWSCGPWSSGPKGASWCWSTASRSSRTTGGPWCSPIPRSRSPTSGPEAPTDEEAGARVQEYAVRLEQLLR